MKKFILSVICAVFIPMLCSFACAEEPEYIYGEGCRAAYYPAGGSAAAASGPDGTLGPSKEGIAVSVDGGGDYVIGYDIFPGEWVSFPRIGDLPEADRPYIEWYGDSSPQDFVLNLRCYIDGVPHDASIMFYEFDDGAHYGLISCDRAPIPAAVSIPTFPVTLNGRAVEPAAGKYPIFVYNDVVYLPLEQGYGNFLGFKSDCSSYLNKITAAVTNGEITARELETVPADGDNSGPLTAEILDYNVYISSQEPQKNPELAWPLLTFRGMTYLPLTWDVCRTLDWELSFEPSTGLVLDTADAFRPSWSSPQSHGMNAAIYSIEKYVIGEDCYAGYFTAGMSTDGSDKKLIWRRKGQPEKRFGAQCLAELGNYVRLGYAAGPNGLAQVEPWLEGNVLNITATSGGKNYFVRIDMENEKLVGCEER